MASSRVRLMIAVALSVVGLVALVVVSIGGDDVDRAASTTVTTSVTVASSDRPDEAPTTSVELPEEWQPKGSSLYSDREPTTSMSVRGDANDADDIGDGVASDGVASDQEGRP